MAVRKSIRRPEHEHLVSVLRSLRVEAGLTQAQLARRLEATQSFMSSYELGQVRLDLVQLEDIARALEVSLIELVRRYLDDKPPSGSIG